VYVAELTQLFVSLTLAVIVKIPEDVKHVDAVSLLTALLPPKLKIHEFTGEEPEQVNNGHKGAQPELTLELIRRVGKGFINTDITVCVLHPKLSEIVTL
jgi:hypothetical protein